MTDEQIRELFGDVPYFADQTIEGVEVIEKEQFQDERTGA